MEDIGRLVLLLNNFAKKPIFGDMFGLTAEDIPGDEGVVTDSEEKEEAEWESAC